jgi:hypothetical protein
MANLEQAKKDQARMQEQAWVQTFLQSHHAINNPDDSGQYNFLRSFLLNPFAYEGKVIAVHSQLKNMVSPTEGVFIVEQEIIDNWSIENRFMVASGLPKPFNPPNARALLVGQVLGKIAMSNEYGAPIPLPHLQIRGLCTIAGQNEGILSHTCQDVKSR